MATKKNTTGKKATVKATKSRAISKAIELGLPFEAKDEIRVSNETEGQPEPKGDEYLSPAFTFKKPIYLQIHRQNIYHYFSTGLISPTKYEKNRPQSDIQSILKDSLQLSNGLLDELKNTDALLQLSFSALEEKEMKIISSVALLSKPIPVSRIKTIYVKSKKDKEDVLAIAKTSDAGIIPDSLIVDHFPETELIIQEESLAIERLQIDYNDKINEFDRVLGSYAFVKNISLLYTNKTHTYANYPDHYLGFVKLLLNDPGIQTDTSVRQYNYYKQLIGLKCNEENTVLKWLFKRAGNDSNFTSVDIVEFGNVLLKNHADSNFQKAGKEALAILNDGIKRKTAHKVISEIRHSDKVYLYIFSFLYLYGNKSAEDRTNSRIGLPNEATAYYAELIFALLGYFYGYTLLRNNDESQSYIDSIINDFAKSFDRPSLKFELTTLFDFYLIEAVYQYVFNESISTKKFEYISPSLDQQKQIIYQNLPEGYVFSITELYGKQFFKLTKKSKSEEVYKKLSVLPEVIPLMSEIGLYCLRNGISFKWNLNAVLSALTDIKKLRGIALVSKSDIAEHVETGKCNIDELSSRIDATIKFKEYE